MRRFVHFNSRNTFDAPALERSPVVLDSWKEKSMLAVEGILLTCAGIVTFYALLHLRRRPQFERWLRARVIGEITIFTSMSISLYGIALLGRFGVQSATQAYGSKETLMIFGILVASALLIWKLYIPPTSEA